MEYKVGGLRCQFGRITCHRRNHSFNRLFANFLGDFGAACGGELCDIGGGGISPPARGDGGFQSGQAIIQGALLARG